MATDNRSGGISRREFLKAAGITLGAVGVTVVMPPSWIRESTDLPAFTFGGPRLLPIRLTDGGNVVGHGVAEGTPTGAEWVAVFIPGAFTGRVDGIEYEVLGHLRQQPIDPVINVTTADSLEIRIELEVKFA